MSLAPIIENLPYAIIFLWNSAIMRLINLITEIPIFASKEEILKAMLLDKGVYALIAFIILALAFVEKHFKFIRKALNLISQKLFLHNKRKQYKNRL